VLRGRDQWPIIAIANHMENQDPPLDQAIIHPRLNWRHTVVDGDTLWQLAANYYGDTGDDDDDDRTQTMVTTVAAATTSTILTSCRSDKFCFPVIRLEHCGFNAY
jgi:hypothetical protein